MRSTLRLLAAVKSSHLTPNAPTGLTGLHNHPNPHYALISLYNRTLSALQGLPETSVYRQSCEALTKHRLSIIESTRPTGYDAWVNATKKIVEESVKADAEVYREQIGIIDRNEQETEVDEGEYADEPGSAKSQSVEPMLESSKELEFPKIRRETRELLRNRVDFIDKNFERAVGHKFETLKGREIEIAMRPVKDEKPVPDPSGDFPQGGQDTEEQMQKKLRAAAKDMLSGVSNDPEDAMPVWWEPAPVLDSEQLAEVENKIGAGLIEEVIQVAEGELKLVKEMTESTPWEPLVEKPPEGQWYYFERGTHTGATQPPERTHT
ncbi:MAG: hypothetical protein Q9227_002882 [Pyrenula ochraceoflavens]